MYKYEVADKIGISMSTFSRWINGRYFHDLVSLGYKKTQKYLTAKQIVFLSEKLDFTV